MTEQVGGERVEGADSDPLPSLPPRGLQLTNSDLGKAPDLSGPLSSSSVYKSEMTCGPR